ncbi:MAG: VCBS repeat-containing protein [Verrucomicrobiales bacterium]|nr:VCBS repeat-containing protein [Verrucomicrobiales bacterium]
MNRDSVNRFTLLTAAAVIASWPLWGGDDPTFIAITDTPLSQQHLFSAAWGDYDGDGFQDLLCVDSFPRADNQAQLLLFKNEGNGAFVKSTLDPSLLPASSSPGPSTSGATWGDFDNDGRLDILVNGGGYFYNTRAASVVLRQEEDNTFAPSPPAPFRSGYSYSGLWADFDGDGLLDVFTPHWDSGSTTDALFQNTGDGWFIDTEAPGIDQANDNPSSVLAATCGDFDGDGDPDIIATTVDPTLARMYVNNGDLSFAGRPLMPDWAGQGFGGGVAAADYDNDGDLDFLSVGKSGADDWSCACSGKQEGYCQLWRNDGTGNFDKVIAGELGNSDTIGADGATWADYNNDGWQDVLLIRSIHSNGQERDPGNLLYRNNGDGTFSKVTEGPVVNEEGDAEAGAWADFDNDGDMDLFVANYRWEGEGVALGSGQFPTLYRNEGNGNHWLKCALTGMTSNRDAIGAKVRVRASINGQGVWQMREIRSNTGWFAAQNDMRPHLGLGDAVVAESVRIEWPSGVVQEFSNVAADQILTVVEPIGLNLDNLGQLSWHSTTGREFNCESAPSLDGPWSPLDEPVEVDGTLRTAAIQTEAAVHFYRLQHSLLPPVPHNPSPDKLAWLRPGTFMMGSPESEPERESILATTGYGDETLHEVTLTESFWISRFETTQPDFLDLMGSNPSTFTGPGDQPVDSVTWHEAVAYCEALTAREEEAARLPEGYVYRLPTEAEWEYACRAGTSTALWLGDELRSRQANFDGTREYSGTAGGTVENPGGANTTRAIPTGLTIYPANRRALSDMIGNLSEWCLDRMDHYPGSPVTDPYVPGPSEEQGAVLRGGAWGDPGSACRSAARDYLAPSARDSHVGFRVVLGKPLQ